MSRVVPSREFRISTDKPLPPPLPTQTTTMKLMKAPVMLTSTDEASGEYICIYIYSKSGISFNSGAFSFFPTNPIFIENTLIV
jgi:hypothetical protein